MIVVVDSGGANLVSLLSWVSRLGVDACVSTCSRKIKNASHVILPGVGSAGKIMERLCALRLKELLQSLTQPVLGICDWECRCCLNVRKKAAPLVWA